MFSQMERKITPLGEIYVTDGNVNYYARWINVKNFKNIKPTQWEKYAEQDLPPYTLYWNKLDMLEAHLIEFGKLQQRLNKLNCGTFDWCGCVRGQFGASCHSCDAQIEYYEEKERLDKIEQCIMKMLRLADYAITIQQAWRQNKLQ